MILGVLIYDVGAEAIAHVPAPAHEPAHMIERAARALVSALEAAVLLTASAQSPEDLLTRAMTGVMDAIAALIMDMTMVVMIVARTTMTTSAATLRVMGPRLRRGDAEGGTTRKVVTCVVQCECIITLLPLSLMLLFPSLRNLCALRGCTDAIRYDFTIFTTTTICD
jgi:hypothetical protein